MNDDIQTIVEIVILLFFVGLMFIPFLLFFVYVFYQNSKRKKIRERTRQAFGQLIGNNNTLPVRYCSERHFKSWLKILPWEGTGLIVPGNGVITFVGEKLNGVALNLQFGRGRLDSYVARQMPFSKRSRLILLFRYARGEALLYFRDRRFRFRIT
jgi:hypothetical protein